jgi:hypothetical protein
MRNYLDGVDEHTVSLDVAGAIQVTAPADVSAVSLSRVLGDRGGIHRHDVGETRPIRIEHVPAGVYYVHGRTANGERLSAPAFVRVRRGETATVALARAPRQEPSAERHLLRGRLVGAELWGLTSAILLFEGTEEAEGISERVEVRVDSGGTFETHLIFPGSYAVRELETGWTTAVSVPMEYLEVELPPPLPLSVHVRDSVSAGALAGVVLRWTTAQLNRQDDPDGAKWGRGAFWGAAPDVSVDSGPSARTDARGIAEVRVPKGVTRMTLERTGYCAAALELRVTEGTQRDVRMERCAEIEVICLESGGSRIVNEGGLRAVLSMQGSAEAVAVSVRNGSAVFAGLLPGLYEVVVYEDDDTKASWKGEVARGETRRLELFLPRGP